MTYLKRGSLSMPLSFSAMLTLPAPPFDSPNPGQPSTRPRSNRWFPAILLGIVLQAGCANSLSHGPASGRLEISKKTASTVGQKIWVNECSGAVAGLTSWNRGEYFASLGIGHFIWYTPERRGPFEESFPSLVKYITGRGTAPPAWLAKVPGCPWSNYEQFHAARDSAQMNELRTYLKNTIPLQTEFLIRRLERALPKMHRTLPAAVARESVSKQFYAVAESPQGVYALIDYVNFKGEGVAASERYQGQGWGLLQVLEGMRGSPRGAAAAQEFSASAKRVLKRRVANAPPERNESRWLPGWTKRCESYAQPL